MKFERVKTNNSKKRLKKVFYFAFVVWFVSGVLTILKLNLGVDISSIVSIMNVLSVISFLILIALYVIHVVIEGLEKPKFISTKTHDENKKNEIS